MKTTQMLLATLASRLSDATGTVMVVAANQGELGRLRDEFAKLATEAGHEASVVCGDTVDIRGKGRVYFSEVGYVESGRTAGMWPGARFVDHYAESRIVEDWKRKHLREIYISPVKE